MASQFLKSSLYRNKVFIVLLLACLLALTYSSLILQDTVLNYDDNLLLGPIGKIHSIFDYFNYVKNGIIADIQPVRDFSYFIDLKLKGLLPFYSFHLSNVLYWFIACILFYQLLLIEKCDHGFALFFLFLYSFSPVSSSSIAWIAARKHILSTLFILAATLMVVRTRKALGIGGFYLLSIFSQPINSLWPVWNYFYSKFVLKKRFILSVVLLLISIASLAINFFYYKTIYTGSFSATSKFIDAAPGENLGLMLLALGRYFYQCLNPFSALPTTHYQGSWENLAGMILLSVFLFYCFKLHTELRKRIISPLLFFILPLSIVSIKRTNIFCSDTYLLTASAGLYWALAIIASEKLNFKWLKTSLFIILIPLFFYNLQYVNLFKDDDGLWIYSQKKEANSQSTAVVASIMIQKKDFYNSYLLIKKLQEEWPEQPFIPQLIAENVFHNPNIAIEKKISTLENLRPQTTSTYLFLSVLYGQNNQAEKIKSTLPKIFSDLKNLNMEYHGSEEKIAAIYFYTCEYFHLTDCKKTLTDFKNRSQNIIWNENIFQKYLMSFEANKGYGVK